MSEARTAGTRPPEDPGGRTRHGPRRAATPHPRAGPGEFVDFGGLFGYGTVVAPACPEGSAGFVRHGGHIPAPIHSLSN